MTIKDHSGVIFQILPQVEIPPGYAYFLVSFQDFENMKRLGWNVDREIPAIQFNVGLKIKEKE